MTHDMGHAPSLGLNDFSLIGSGTLGGNLIVNRVDENGPIVGYNGNRRDGISVGISTGVTINDMYICAMRFGSC